MLKILVISDTHVPTIAREIPTRIIDEGRSCDMIIHAGDIVSNRVVEQLSKIAPIHIVRGNMDAPDLIAILPPTRIVRIGDWRIGIVHGHEGRGGDTPRRALDAFGSEHLDCVIFGHSHQPLKERLNGTLLFNPGSPVAGRGPMGNTYGILELTDGFDAEIVQLE